MIQENDYVINGVFPTPVYMTQWDSAVVEEKEIEDIINEGLRKNEGNHASNNSYVFDTKLKKLKEFVEQNIKIYVEQCIIPDNEINLYITQSWLNVNKPGDSHHSHAHPNSILSGVFYVSAGEDDQIMFYDPNHSIKDIFRIEPREHNTWNSTSWFFPVYTNNLIIFPSWLTHVVKPNEKATKDRISLSFNTFLKGTTGYKNTLSELVLH